MVSDSTLQRKNAENLEQIFPEKEYRDLSPNFHIHVSVSELYIPRIELPFLLEEICGPILGIYKSLTDTWMWKLGLRIPRKGIFKRNCRCSGGVPHCLSSRAGQAENRPVFQPLLLQFCAALQPLSLVRGFYPPQYHIHMYIRNMYFTNMTPVRQLTVYIGGKNPPILLTKWAKVFRDHGLAPKIVQICMGGGGGSYLEP